MMLKHLPGKIIWQTLLLITVGFMIGCSGTAVEETAVSTTNHSPEEEMLTLPTLAAVELDGQLLKVIASTSLIGDVVSQVGGTTIDLTTLMAPGQDPHSYEPGAQELTAVAQADVIFVNGWDLEESLAKNLETIGGDVPVIPISANIMPLEPGEADHEEGEESAEADHEHGEADPHVWFNVAHVKQWTENSAQVLSSLDPANAAAYQENADIYLTQLTELETEITAQIAAIPQANRILVTNHDSLGYFAQAYDFEVLGTVIPGSSTVAEPSASDLAELIEVMNEHNVCTIFTETTVSDNLSQTVTAELDNCDSVTIVPLYTGAVGAAGSGAENYIDMMRANVAAVVTGLK